MTWLLGLWLDVLCPLWEDAPPSRLDLMDGVGTISRTAEAHTPEVVLPRNL